MKGLGVAENKEEGVKWLHKAADKGNSDAMGALASCYFLGEGAPMNKAEAIRLLRKSAKMGNPEAQKALKQLGIR